MEEEEGTRCERGMVRGALWKGTWIKNAASWLTASSFP